MTNPDPRLTKQRPVAPPHSAHANHGTAPPTIGPHIQAAALWFNAVSDAIVVADVNWVIQDWNTAAEQIYGWPRAAVLGQSISAIIPTRWYLDGESDATATHTLLVEGIWRGTFVQHTHDGREVVIEGSTRTLFDAQGTPIGYIAMNRDVTERVRAKEALRAREERFQAMIEHGSDVVLLVDAQRRITYTSPNITTMLGYPVESIPVLELLQITHPDDRAALDAFREQMFALPSEIGRLTVRTRHQDGSWHWLERSVSNQLHHPAIQHVIVSFRDVTERVNATTALHQVEQQFSVAFHASPVPFAITEAATGRYVECNTSMQELLGYTNDELMGQTSISLNVFLDPHERTVLRELLTADGMVHDHPLQLRTNTGAIRQVLVSITGLMVGETACLFTVVVDVTERNRIKQALRSTADRLTVMHEIDRALLALHTPTMIATTVLGPLRDLIPCQHATIGVIDPIRHGITFLAASGELMGTPPVGVFIPSIPDGYLTAIQHRQAWLVNDLQQERSDQPMITSMQALGVRSVLRIPLHNEGELIGILNLLDSAPDTFTADHVTIAQQIADMVELALHQDRLVDSLKQELAARTRAEIALTAEHERVVRLKNEFMATMSHELRTPLAAVLGQSELLLEAVHGPLTAAQIASIRTIEQRGRHLLALINDILDYIRFEAGRMRIDLMDTVIADVCRESIRLVSHEATRKGIGLTTLLDTDATIVHADQRRLQQLLTNLLANAVKFTPNGGEVGLEVHSDPQQEQITFTIWDTGIGIADANLARLFQPFSQLDSRLSREYEGTGLGLALVLRLAEAHGGSVHVTSTLGQGSRFTATLPWAPRGESRLHRDESPQHHLAPAPATPPPSPGLTILLVEDNDANRAIMVKGLEVAGYRVVVATTGREAIALVQATQPALIVMDVQLPDISGIEVMQTIRADQQLRAIPMIAVTALVMPGDREHCLEAGAGQYLSKPVSLRVLRECVAAQLAAA